MNNYHNINFTTTQRRPPRPLEEVILRLQAHVFSHRIRIGEFFRDYDPLNSGKVTVTCFLRALEAVGISETWPSKLFLTLQEFKNVVCHYKDPKNSNNVLWKDFINDIDLVFGEPNLEKRPEVRPQEPGGEIMEKIKLSSQWKQCDKEINDLLEEALAVLRRRAVELRPLDLKRAFIDYDKWSNYRNKFDRQISDTRKNGHVTQNQLLIVLTDYGIKLTDKQFWALRLRYTDDFGFYYFPLLQDIGLESVKEPLTRRLIHTSEDDFLLISPVQYNKFVEKKRLLKNQVFAPLVRDEERNIVMLMEKLKKKVISERIDLRGQLSQYDYQKIRRIDKHDFKRAFDPKLNLTPTEIDLLFEVFQTAPKSGFVDYNRLCSIIEGCFTEKDFGIFSSSNLQNETKPKEDDRVVGLALQSMEQVIRHYSGYGAKLLLNP